MSFQILEAFHHPYYAMGNSQIQNKMFERMEMWFGGLGPEDASQVIQRLTKVGHSVSQEKIPQPISQSFRRKVFENITTNG
jgi:(2Fe-2S) ferredoxin